MDSKIPSLSQAERPEGDGILFLRRDGVPSLSSSSPRRWDGGPSAQVVDLRTGVSCGRNLLWLCRSGRKRDF